MTKMLLIRADAGGKLGTGHVMRMIALAQAWQDLGGLVAIASCQCPQSLIERIRSENIDFAMLETTAPGAAGDLEQTIQLGKSLESPWVVLDGYHFGESYPHTLKENGFKILAIDDYGHCESWNVDLILNQNIQDRTSEEVAGKTCLSRLLLGPRYALLRREFRKCPDRVDNTQGDPLRILVTFGGVDPEGYTLRILEAISRLPTPKLNVRVLAGPANPRLTALQYEAAKSHHPIEIIPSTQDMPSLYRWADRVISAGGSSCYEWMYFQVPGWVTSIAENQNKIVQTILDQSLAAGLPRIDTSTTAEISASLQSWLNGETPRHLNVIDGFGALRVAAAMCDSKCWLRPVRTEDDARFLFDLANHESVRSAGRYPTEIHWDGHLEWLRHHCESQHSRLMIIELLEHGPAGQIRFHETEPGVWEIGISIHPDFRKGRMALTSLAIAMNQFARERRVLCWKAEIKCGNLASQGLFSKLGFSQCAEHGELQTWLLHHPIPEILN